MTALHEPVTRPLSARDPAIRRGPWGREFDQPFPWRALITRTKRCVVLIGAIGLYPTAERAFTWMTTLLEQATHAGELVEGGWCAVTQRGAGDPGGTRVK